MVEAEVLVFDHLVELRLVAATVAAAVLGVVVWRLLAELASRAAGHRAERTITPLRVLRIAVIVGWIGPMLGAMAVGAISGTGYDPVWDDPAAKLALVADIVALALVAELFIDAREPWALHPAAVRRLGAWSDDVRR